MRKITVYIYVLFFSLIFLSGAKNVYAQCGGDPTGCYTPAGDCCSNWENCCYCDQAPGKIGCSGEVGTYRCLSPNFCGGSGSGGDDHLPTGWLDVADCTAFQGWAGDQDNGNVAINVEFYADGVLIPSSKIRTTVAREAGVCTSVGGSNCGSCPSSSNPGCVHGFYFTTPSYLKNGAAHNITVWAYNIKSDNTETSTGTAGRNQQLAGTPKTITCAPENVPPIAYITGTDISSSPALNLPTNTLTSVYEGDILRFGVGATDSNNNLSNLRLINWGDGIFTRDLIVPSLSCSGVCGGLSSSYDFNTNIYGRKTLYFYTYATDQLGAAGASGVIQVYVRPKVTLSGVIFETPISGSCSASALINSGTVTIFNGPTMLGTTTISGGNYSFPNLRYGSNISSICVSPPPPPTGAYRLSCVINGANTENAYPQPVCYTLANPIVNMTTNRTLNVGLRLITQEPWFTALFTDVYGGNGVSQTIPDPPVAPTTFSGYLGDWAAGSVNANRSYSFTSSGGILNINGIGRSGKIYRLMSGTVSDTRGGFAMRMPFAADKMWPASYVNLTLPTHGQVTDISTKLQLSTLDPNAARVYRLTNSNLFDSAGIIYDFTGPGVAVLYYTGATPLRINGLIRHNTGALDERLLIVSTAAPIEISSAIGTISPSNGLGAHIQAGLITTGSGVNNQITYLSTGASNDLSIIAEGPIVSKTVDMRRNLGTLRNQSYPANVHLYNYNYLYRLTRMERNSADISNYTGLSVVDVSYGVVQ